MKQRSESGSLIGLALLVICVLGCSSSSSKTANTVSAGNANSGQPTVAATGTSASTPDIAGNYAVTGTNEDGSPYKGDLEIIKRGDVYQFRWNAGKQYDGVGVENGKIVAVAFTEGSDGKGCGVVSYQLIADGVLDGRWGYWGTNESGTERATPVGGSGLSSNYDTTGKNPDGTSYKGKLSIASAGRGYKFVWSNDSSGFGVKQGNALTVGIGGSRCAFVAYEIKTDGMLDGVWGGYGSNKTGTEKAVRKN